MITPETIIYRIILLVVSTIGVVRFKHLTTPFKMIAILIPLTFLVEVLNIILARTIRNNLMVSHFFAPIEFVLISLTYYYLLVNRYIKTSIIVAIPVFICFSVYNSVFVQNMWHQFASNAVLFGLAIYLIYTLFGFAQMLLVTENRSLNKQPEFWLNTGLLIYSSTLFLNFGLQNYLHTHHIKYDVLDSVGLYVNMLLYTLVGIALSIDSNETSSARAR